MLQSDNILGIIPARMASTRFPGKPLVMIKGIPMVIRVYQIASGVLNNLAIASGDPEIKEAADKFGAPFILTGNHHVSGTSRCMEAMKIFSERTKKEFGALLNIQGDEPMVSTDAITLLADDISGPGTGISTLIRPENDPVAFANPNRVKVVINREHFALYFSRSPIPFNRAGGSSWYSHVGMYAFKKEILERISCLDPGPLETAESLEQLRWLENGLPIHCCQTDYSGFGVDTPADLELLLKSGLL